MIKIFYTIIVHYVLCCVHYLFVVRDSAVGIATRYGLTGPGIEFRWGRNFPHPSIPDLGPTKPPIQWIVGLFSGDKADPGVAVITQPHLAPRLKKE